MTPTTDVPSLPMVRCAHCGRVDTVMRPVCAGCLSSDLRPEAVPGTGQVVSFTTIRRAPTQFRDQAPYEIVIVDLDAGPRVTGRLAPESPPPAIGSRVRALRAERADTVFTVSLPS